jgi:long-subunit fatty acid transport protein
MSVPHNWNDSWSLRLGGSYTFHDIVDDGALTLRTGVLYEARAAPKQYSRLDFLPHQRVGISIGAGFSWGRYDFNIGYFHLFHETHNVAPPAGAPTCADGVTEPCGSEVRQVVPWASDGFGEAVGNGTYAMSIDEWTFSATVRFGDK